MELNSSAWDQWVLYRAGIKKPIKPASLEAAKLKLMRFGDDQQAVVDQSIAQGWQGLFAVDVVKTDPSAPKTRTKQQQAADDANWDYLNKQSEKHWNLAAVDPIGKLKVCLALWSRYNTEADQGSMLLAEKRSWLRDKTAELLRECDPALVLQDYHVSNYVRWLFPRGGIARLEMRAKDAA